MSRKRKRYFSFWKEPENPFSILIPIYLASKKPFKEESTMKATAELYEINNGIRETLTDIQAGELASEVSLKLQKSLTDFIYASQDVIDLFNEGSGKEAHKHLKELGKLGGIALKVAQEEHADTSILDRITMLNKSISSLKI
jgi:endonuclease III